MSCKTNAASRRQEAVDDLMLNALIDDTHEEDTLELNCLHLMRPWKSSSLGLLSALLYQRRLFTAESIIDQLLDPHSFLFIRSFSVR